jgi:hypothetical protein
LADSALWTSLGREHHDAPFHKLSGGATTVFRSTHPGSHGARRRTRAGLTSAAALVAAAAFAVPAHSAVTNGEAVEVFHGRDFVGLVGYDPNTPLQVVVRNQAGEPIGFANVETDAAGNYELNHVGVDPPINDCFGGGSTPDIQPGDTVSVMVNGDPARVDSTVVQDVTGTAPVVNADGTITVTGAAQSPSNATPPRAALNSVEVRLNRAEGVWDADGAGGRKDWRVTTVPEANGNFTAVFAGASAEDLDAVADAEFAVEWSNADLSELTVFDGLGEDLGCGPLSRNTVTVPAAVVRTPAPVTDPGTGTGTATGGTIVNTRVVTVVEPVAQQGIKGVQASALRVSRLSLARRVSLAQLSRRGVQASMRLPAGTRALRIAVYRARDGRRTGPALLAVNRRPSSGGIYRVALRNRALLRKMRAGQYVLEVRAGRSAATLGAATRAAFRVTR